MHVIKINEERGHEFEREKGEGCVGELGGGKGREKRCDYIIIISKINGKKIKRIILTKKIAQ